MGLEDSHYDVLEKIYNNRNNKDTIKSTAFKEDYHKEIRELDIDNYIEIHNDNDVSCNDVNLFETSSDDDWGFSMSVYSSNYDANKVYYSITEKGINAYEKHLETLEFNKRLLLASEKSADSAVRSARSSEKSADSAERSVQASEISANAAVRSAKAAEDSAKSAHKSNRISFASLIVSAIAIICSIVVPIVTLLIK